MEHKVVYTVQPLFQILHAYFVIGVLHSFLCIECVTIPSTNKTTEGNIDTCIEQVDFYFMLTALVREKQRSFR